MPGPDKPFDQKALNERLDVNFALKAAGLGVWELDPVTNLVNWDDRCRELFGLAKGNLLPYEKAIECIHPDDLEKVNQAVAWAMNPESDGEYDLTYRTIGVDDRLLRWVRFSGRSYFNEAGELIRFAGVAQDVSHEITSRLQQQASERRFRSLIEEAPVSTCLFVGPNMTIDVVNEVMLGYWRRDKSVIGKPLIEALPELKGQPHLQILEEVYRTGKTYEAREIRADLIVNGEPKTYYFDLIHKPLRNEAGQVYGIMDMSMDVTEQVLARRKIEESETKLRGLIAAAPAGIGLFVGRDLIIENPNQTFIDIVGKGPDVAGLPLREAMPELLTEGQPFLNILDDVYTTGVPFISPASLVKIVQNGVLHDNYYNISYTPVYNAAGEVYAILDIAIDVTAQVKAQQALVESEAHLQLLRNTVPAMIFYLDAQQRYQSYNGVFRDWFGVEGNEVIGKTVQEFLGQEAYQKTLPHLTIAYSGQQERYEMYAPSRMGTARWLSIVYTPHKTAEGTVIGVIVHATDITQNKLTEMELRHSEARFRSLIEQAPVATGLFVGRNLLIELANEPMLQFWGKGKDVFGKPLAVVLPELEDQPFMDILDQVYTTGQPYQALADRCDLVVDGQLRTFYFNFTYQPIFDEQGRVYAIMDMAVDVTQQVIATQHLAEVESGLRGAVELAQLGTWSIDVATHGLTFSDRLIEWFGYDPEAKEYIDVIPILQAEDQKRVDRAVAWALNPESDGIYNETYTVIHPQTGQQRILHAHGKTVFDASGKAIRLNGTAQDITLQREQQLALEQLVQVRTEDLAATNEELAATNEEYAALNEELEEANGLLMRSNDNLQTFAYVASHDLQEPLRKIQQFGNLLSIRQETLSSEEQLYIERMQSAASRMSTLIRDLLNFSRISTQRDVNKPVSLNEVIARDLTTLELVIAETNAQVEVGYLPTVQGDATQLDMLFQNVLANALKFRRIDSSGVPIAPLIQINAHLLTADQLPSSVKPTWAAQAYHRIDVVDNGIGFDEKYLDRIFQVFQRLHGKNEYTGTGIGLAICERVVTNHGGAITANSQPGQGATFSVYLPM